MEDMEHDDQSGAHTKHPAVISMRKKCKKHARAFEKCVLTHHGDSCGCDPTAPANCDLLRMKLVHCQASRLAPDEATLLERCMRSVMSQGTFSGRNHCAPELDAAFAALSARS